MCGRRSQTPASYVVAVREVSVAFAALLGVVVLKEKMTVRKAVGLGVILAGIGLIRFA